MTFKYHWPAFVAKCLTLLFIFWGYTLLRPLPVTPPLVIDSFHDISLDNIRGPAWHQRLYQSRPYDLLNEYLVFLSPTRGLFLNNKEGPSSSSHAQNTNDFSMLSVSDFALLVHEALPGIYQNRIKDFIPLIVNLSHAYHVNPLWVLAMMWAESHFNVLAHSHASAVGLMQIVPATGAQILMDMGAIIVPEKQSTESFLANPYINIEAGIFYFRSLLDTYSNYRLATVAYNMGPGWVRNRLNRRLGVGDRNLYFNKVQTAYSILSQNFLKKAAMRFNADTAFKISLAR